MPSEPSLRFIIRNGEKVLQQMCHHGCWEDVPLDGIEVYEDDSLCMGQPAKPDDSLGFAAIDF